MLNKVRVILLAMIGFFPLFLFSQKDTLKVGKTKQILIFPVIAKSIETNWSFGVAATSTFHLSKSDTISRTSNVQFVSLYSLKKQFIAAINGAQYFKNESYILNEQVSFSSFPDKFWGLGNKTPSTNEESYDFNQYYVNIHLLKNLGHKLFVGALFEAQKAFSIDYKPGGLFDQENIAGRKGYFVAGLGASITFDNRNGAFSPNKGNFIQIFTNHFDKYLGSDFVYTNLVLDFRKYMRIHKQQVLAVQAFCNINYGDEIPLRSLASLGGSNMMRGYYSGRFRDENLIVLQADYRIPLFNRFGAVVFAGTGEVGKTNADYRIDELKYSCGAGLRYAINKSEKLNIRLDFGYGGKGNSGLYFQLGEAF